MRSVLVPTDFSELSRPAVFYAARLARELNSSLILFHIIDISNSETMFKRSRLEEEVIQLSKADAEDLIAEVKKEIGDDISIRYEYRMGHPFHIVTESFVKQNNISLIVMGTHGASGLRKMLFGSIASSVINNSSIPVIAVPPDATFNLKRIFYATDLTNLAQELELLSGYAATFGATIHVMHVVTRDEAIAYKKEKVKEEIKRINYKNIYFHVLVGEEIPKILDTFVRRSKAPLLAMFTHKLDFFEKLFGKSVTQVLASKNQLPLLTFNKTKMNK